MTERKPDDIDRSVAARIRTRRKALGMSQKELGEKLGITYQQFQRYEVGGCRITSGRLFQIAKAMETPIAYFFGDDAPSNRSRAGRRITSQPDETGLMLENLAYCVRDCLDQRTVPFDITSDAYSKMIDNTKAAIAFMKQKRTHPEANGHAKPSRKQKGVVVLRNLEIGREVLDALTAHGWLHEVEGRNREAVTAALSALTLASLNAGMKPVQPGKAYIPVEISAVDDAVGWLKPGTAITAESAGQALGTLSGCASLAGFTPAIYAGRLRAMVAEIEARGVVATQELTH